MIVAGIDENGLGPGLGVLVVTAVALELPGDDPAAAQLDRLGLGSALTDSKVVFRRSLPSYRKGESAALALLDACAVPRSDLASAVARLSHDAGRAAPEVDELHVGRLPLPLWGGEPSEVAALLAARGVGVRDLRCRVLAPAAFNRERLRHGSKSTLDYVLFEEALAGLAPQPDHVLADKIGGRKAYADLLGRGGRFSDLRVLSETSAESAYDGRFRGRPTTIRFLRGGDARHAPIALASLVGKYVREASMLCLNRALGFDADLPHASGYWSDPKTHEAIARFEERLADRVPRDAFLRKG